MRFDSPLNVFLVSYLPPAGSGRAAEARDAAAFRRTAPGSLRGSETRLRAAGGSGLLVFDGPCFGSLLPVSVKAELNVNQARTEERHERKQMELRAARWGGPLPRPRGHARRQVSGSIKHTCKG